jgi:hypothetical protein
MHIELLESIESVLTPIHEEDGDHTEFLKSIENSFYKQFPNGIIKAVEDKRRLDPNKENRLFAISLGLISDINDVSSKIRGNDPMHTLIFIYLESGEYKAKLVNGSLSLNPEPGSFMAMSSAKLPFRAFKTKDQFKVLSTMDTFFIKLKDLVKANQDNFYRSQDIPKKYFVETAELTSEINESSNDIQESSNSEVTISHQDLLQASGIISKYPNGIRLKVKGKNKFSLELYDKTLLDKDPNVSKLFSSTKLTEDTIDDIPVEYENQKEVFSNEDGKIIETRKDGFNWYFVIPNPEMAMESISKPFAYKHQAMKYLKDFNN